MNLIPEVMSNIEKLKTSSMDSTAIAELHRYIVTIDNSAEVISINSVRGTISDIRVKLDWVIKGSGFLLETEIMEIEENFFTFFKNFQAMSEKLNIILPENVKNIYNQTRNIGIISPSTDFSYKNINNAYNDENSLKSDINAVIADLMLIANSSFDSKNVDDAFIDKLSQNIKSIANTDASKIFSKILEICLYIKSCSNKPGQEIIEVIRQSAETAELFALSSTDEIGEDPNLIIQRLAILQQMVEMAEQEAKDRQDKFSAEVNYSPASQKTELCQRMILLLPIL